MRQPEWKYLSSKKPKQWTNVECVTSNGEHYPNALYRYKGEFFDLSRVLFTDSQGAKYQYLIPKVKKWKYHKDKEEFWNNYMDEIDHKKYVYVVYDPLHEDVLCVHESPESTCESCKDKREEDRNAYQISVEKFLLKP